MFTALVALGVLSGPQEAAAQWTYPGCTNLPADLSTGFTVTPIISRARFPIGVANDTLARPIKMAFDTSGGKLDIYFTEKFGKIKHYRANFNGSDSSIRVVGKVPNVNVSFNEDGLWGIALDPDFKNNRQLYVMYAYGPGVTTGAPAAGSATVGWRVSRFTLNAGTLTLNTASEQILLHIRAGMGDRWHTAGSIRFDNFGNLYVTLGDNETLMMGAGNTADLRGGILRIRPGPGATYTVPAGNFGAYWADYFQGQGRSALATQYRDTSKVRPEIYVKGSRNPYSFGLDPNRQGWVTWAECGPDNAGNNTEEHNIVTAPAFSGWPFWAGTARQASKALNYNEPAEPTTAQWATYNPTGMTMASPRNTWPGWPDSTPSRPRRGVDTLPPMLTPYYTYNQSCAQGGPIVRYDGRINRPGQLPPHLDNVWFLTDFQNSNIYAVKINASGTPTLSAPTSVLPAANYPRSTTAASIGRPIDFQQGPDGALYMMNWGAGCCDGNGGGQSAYTGIVRISYSGATCRDTTLFPVAIDPAREVHRGQVTWFKLGARMVSVRADGAHEVRILDMGGRLLHSYRGEGSREYALPDLGKGMYVIQAKTREGIAVRTFNRM